MIEQYEEDCDGTNALDVGAESNVLMGFIFHIWRLSLGAKLVLMLQNFGILEVVIDGFYKILRYCTEELGGIYWSSKSIQAVMFWCSVFLEPRLPDTGR